MRRTGVLMLTVKLNVLNIKEKCKNFFKLRRVTVHVTMVTVHDGGERSVWRRHSEHLREIPLLAASLLYTI